MTSCWSLTKHELCYLNAVRIELGTVKHYLWPENAVVRAFQFGCVVARSVVENVMWWWDDVREYSPLGLNFG